MKQIIEKHPVIACFSVVLLAYLPIASFLFAVKNDFFAAYFPLKFFLSESIAAGSFPLWNPFLNYGFPTYGDMSLGYWNPLTWFIAGVPGYNAYTFTLELLAYLLLSVWGMYKLSSFWITDTRIRQLMTIAYTCSGFVVGHLQHFNWITGAALVPCCLFLTISYLRSGAVKTLITSILACFWLFSSAHPGISIGFFLFCIPLFIHLNLLARKNLARLAVLILATVLLSGGMIYGYSEVLPYTNRSAPVGETVMVQNSTTAISWISLISPLPTTKNDALFRNDISMRNCFIGILMLASIVLILTKKTKGTAGFFLITGLAFLLLSSELVLPFYKYLPLVNFVRLNSEFRLYALLSFIIGGGMALQEALTQPDKKLSMVVRTICLLLGLSVLGAAIFGLATGNLSILHLSMQGKIRPAIKGFISGLTMADTIIIQGTIQLALAWLMLRFIQSGHTAKLIQTAVAEIILATLLQIPFTGVGQLSPAKINDMVRQSPHGFLTPSMKAESAATSSYPDTKKIIGSWELYSKQIAMDSLFPYPLSFRSTLDFFDSGTQGSLHSRPAFFLLHDSTTGNIKISYSPNQIELNALLVKTDTLVVKQNNFIHWKASVDGKPVPTTTTYKTLIGIPLAAGKQNIRLEFSNDIIKWLLIAELVAVALLLMAYTWMSLRKNHRIRYIFP